MTSASPTRLWLRDLPRALGESDDVLLGLAAKKLGVDPGDFLSFSLLKRSLDARGLPSFTCQVEVELPKLPAHIKEAALPEGVTLAPAPESLLPRRYTLSARGAQERVVIVGAGPAGLFCAHRLSDQGLRPILLDRGQPVEVRGRHVSALMHKGELDQDSNICFGEGGAGTWSDGKLYTRVRDVRVRHIMETIVALGGPERILVDGKPHLGTDKLVALCKAFRAHLQDHGCEVRFGAMVESLVTTRVHGRETVCGVRLRGGELVEADRVILAVGHSAREMYHTLRDGGVFMEPKPFAVGYRVEHPQALINEIQYGKYADLADLPTADYRLAANFGTGQHHRGVYSFCMCPGGQVVPSSTLPGHVCVNGMSHASRRGHWANSALVVTLKPEEFGALGGPDVRQDVLAGLAFQEEAERRAYELGGGGFLAPAQRLTDFGAMRPTREVRKTTYKPGISPADLSQCYPDFIQDALRRALGKFETKMKGFNTQDALLIGVETRTSAPVQITREADSLESISLDKLYPCGEGAGYGGGIVSAALDGLRVAERILEEVAVKEHAA